MVVTATEQLVVRESHAHHTIRVAQELIKALLGLDVPNSNRVVVARREKPLIKDFAVLVSFAVSVDGHHPALVSDELFYITLDQVVRSDYLVTAADKEPLFVQVKAVDDDDDECELILGWIIRGTRQDSNLAEEVGLRAGGRTDRLGFKKEQEELLNNRVNRAFPGQTSMGVHHLRLPQDPQLLELT